MKARTHKRGWQQKRSLSPRRSQRSSLSCCTPSEPFLLLHVRPRGRSVTRAEAAHPSGLYRGGSTRAPALPAGVPAIRRVGAPQAPSARPRGAPRSAPAVHNEEAHRAVALRVKWWTVIQALSTDDAAPIRAGVQPAVKSLPSFCRVAGAWPPSKARCSRTRSCWSPHTTVWGRGPAERLRVG